MKGQWTRVVGAITWLLISGCQTPGLMGPGMSASDSGNSSDSNSGNSSQGDSSQSNSGESTKSDSSQSQSNSSQSKSSEQSNASSENTNASSEASKPSSENSKGSSENSQSSESSKNSQTSQGNVLSFSSVGATVGGLGLAFWQILRTAPVGAPAPADVGQAAQVYLRARTHQLREDLALGAGPSIEDLAAMARIRRENLRVFGRLLREHRVELLTMADAATLTPEHALDWLERVGQIASTDPRLQEDRRAFLAAHGVHE